MHLVATGTGGDTTTKEINALCTIRLIQSNLTSALVGTLKDNPTKKERANVRLNITNALHYVTSLENFVYEVEEEKRRHMESKAYEQHGH